jgi:hypothetical protein
LLKRYLPKKYFVLQVSVPTEKNFAGKLCCHH